MKCYTVTMVDLFGGPPWVSVFSSKRRAEEYAAGLQSKILRTHMQCRCAVYAEDAVMNDRSYTDCFEDVYTRGDE